MPGKSMACTERNWELVESYSLDWSIFVLGSVLLLVRPIRRPFGRVLLGADEVVQLLNYLLLTGCTMEEGHFSEMYSMD